MTKKELTTIGWREWVTLPELNIKKIKAKVDSGARTSSLHAHGLKYITNENSEDFVQFYVNPFQDTPKDKVMCTAKLIGKRKVKSSNGLTEVRPVIATHLELMGHRWNIELTLTNRDEMGFRMLLGRTSIAKNFLIDVSKSFLSLKNR